MLIDANKVSDHHTFQTDVCVVGAGAAGLALASELDQTPHEVLLVESGGFHPDSKTQLLYEGKSAGEEYSLSEHRVRRFGGTTHRWGGICVPYDALDFEVQPWLPYSGWPFRKDDLQPYYERAHVICGLPDTSFYDVDLSARTAGRPRLFADSEDVLTRMLHFPSTANMRFGHAYRAQMQRSKNVMTLLGGNVTEIETHESGQHVEQLKVQSLAGRTLNVRARHVVLATGGIEVPRLLLASNRVHTDGIGNEHDLVGRFFMEHFYGVVGVIKPPDATKDFSFYTDTHRIGPGSVAGYLTLSEEVRAQHGLYGLQLRPYRLVEAEETPGVVAYRQLREEVLERKLGAASFGHLGTMLEQRGKLMRYFRHRARLHLSREASLSNPIFLVGGLEQEPDPNNRVTLSSERDQLGQQRAELYFRLTDADWDSCRRTMALFDQVFQEHGLSRLEAADHFDVDAVNKFGAHHMGTTRMHDDVTQGVVNSDCRVHGVGNLFVASCSVFPTGGSANPTLTIVALAVRLADHLRELLQTSSTAPLSAAVM